VTVAGLVLAAGAGTRAGGPKALRSEPDGRSWVAIAVSALAGAGCSPVFVVLGAAAEEALSFVPDGAVVVVNPDWSEGLSTSVRAGLRACADTGADGVLITLVDLPWMTAAQAADSLALVGEENPRAALARPTIDGGPGHPVYVGRDHWEPLAATLSGDEGAGAYLRSHSRPPRHP